MVHNIKLRDDPYIYPVTFVFYCMFLFYQFQPVLVLINCPSVFVPVLKNDFDFITCLLDSPAQCTTLYVRSLHTWSIQHTPHPCMPDCPSLLSWYCRQPNLIVAMVYFTFPFNIYNQQIYPSKYYLLLLTYVFFDDIYFQRHVLGV